jgi:voltage-gated potassium channel
MEKSYLSLSQISRRFIWTGLALVSVLFAGTAGYRIISNGNSSIIDCLYMTLTTITTIGFGEIVDLSSSPQGRVFTMLLALCGIGIITYTLSNLTAFIVEGSLNEAFLRRKMEKTIKRLTDHFIICGIEGVGHYVINELYETGHPHVIVDSSRQNIEKFLHDYHEDFFIVGDATDNDTLLEAGIMKASGLFAVTGDDNNNLVISITAKQINPAVRVIACCYDLKNMEKIKKAGADAVVSPTFIGGLRMASEMIRPAVVSFLDIMLRDKKKNLRIEEIPVPDSYAGQPLSVLNLHKYPDTLLLAVKIKNEWIFNPSRQYVFTPHTTLILMTTPHDRSVLENLLK